ncbi:MAG: filamentous hemagglutinin N-terminal domain-containing protein, partial [Burkholderiaceae bacterium]|nr:filamentous hemagglutinin N-terminal domain-containing protein [Burkholderiaceae bacterium]
MKKQSFPPLTLKRKLLAVMVAACYGVAQANPLAPQVIAGQALFNQQGNVFTITNTPNTIINWQAFSINPNEVTRFIQQSGDSRVLNRITGQDPSRILGALQSNGQVYLVNPNGVLFGKDARVDVNGLVASSLALSDSDFLAGKKYFNGGSGNAGGKVVNQGAIVTPNGGHVYLIASDVENSGVITSPQGEIVLAAGHTVQLADSHDPQVHVVVSAPANQALNLGQVLASGGRVGIYGALVNQRGVVNANSAVRTESGKIVLKASGTTLLEQGSVTSATNSAGKGGEIQLLGQNVALNGDAQADASGVTGGTVLVGGDYQGRNPAVPTARQAFVSANAAIRANASGAGQRGGKVIVWGDDAARVYGAISAQGGAQGQGGLVETSGHYLDVAGARIDTRATGGNNGLWLLDPENIAIDASYTGPNTLDAVQTFNAGAATGTTSIHPAQLDAATSDILLQARNNIDINSAVNVAQPGVKLTAQAGGSIHVGAAVTTQGGDVTLQANHGDYATGSGAVQVQAAVSTNGGAFNASGAQLAINGAVNVGAGAVDLRANSAGGAIAIGGTGSITGTVPVPERLFSFIADNVSIDGSVDGGGTAGDTTVSFTPYTSSRPITIGASRNGASLGLTAADLGRVSAYGVNLGSAGATGGITVGQELDLSTNVRNVVFESAGGIQFNAKVKTDTDAGLIYVGAYGDTAGITFNSGGAVHANNVLLRANQMNLGSVTNTVQATSTVKLAAYSPDKTIAIGQAPTEAPNALALTVDQLRAISAPEINIGDKAGGKLIVTNELDLSAGSSAPAKLLLAGAEIALRADVKVGNMLALMSDGAIAQSGGAITAPQLLVEGGSVALSSDNAVQNLAGSATSGTFFFENNSALNVTTVAGVNGITLSGASSALSITAPTVNVQQPLAAPSGTILVNATAITVGNSSTPTSAAIQGGSVLMSAESIAVQAGAAVQGSSVVYETDNLALATGSTTTGTTSVAVTSKAGSAMVVGAGAADTLGTLAVDTAELATMTGPSLLLSTAGNLTVNEMNLSTTGHISGNLVLSGQSGVTLAGAVTAPLLATISAEKGLVTNNAKLTANSVLISGERFAFGANGAIAASGTVSMSASDAPVIAIGAGVAPGEGGVSLSETAMKNIAANTLIIQNTSANGSISVGTLDLSGTQAYANTQVQLKAPNVTASGTVKVPASLTLSATSTVRNSGALQGKNVALQGKYITLDSGSTVNATTQASLAASGSTVVIGSGATDAGTTTGLSEAELRTITTPLLNMTSSAAVDLRALDLSGAGPSSMLSISGATLGVTGAVNLPNTQTLKLTASSGGLSQTAAIAVPALSLHGFGGNVALTQANNVNTLSADLSGGNLSLTNARSLASAGIKAPGGTVSLNVAGNLTQGTGLITADTLNITATGSIGSTSQALPTKVSVLSAESTATSGNSPINIVNENYTANPVTAHAGQLTVYKLKVANGNSGAVTLNNTGATVVDSTGVVATDSGKISITAHSPLTIDGTVETVSGDIDLTASSSSSGSDALTFANTAQVKSTTGFIKLAAGTTISGVTTSTVQAAPGKLTQIADMTNNPTVAPTPAPTSPPTSP